MTGLDLARAAEELVGSPFRLHGRDPITGLDCIGLLAAAMEKAGRRIAVPTGYPLRLRDAESWIPDPASCGMAKGTEPFEPGDVILLQSGPAQLHLAIAARADRWIHAHLGLRRVVCQNERPDGAIIHHFRLSSGD